MGRPMTPPRGLAPASGRLWGRSAAIRRGSANFVPNFFFGCESDDPTVTYAFAKANPFGAKLGAVLSSDISHFDVPDMTEVLEEAWELVEDKGLSEEDFHAFSFGNAVRLWASLNRDFFKGTVVEREARQYLDKNPQTAQSAAVS
jgi:hypothetical protein